MEKEMLVLQYEALVRSELRKKNADAFPYQKIFAFFGTVLQSIFLHGVARETQVIFIYYSKII